MQIEANFGEHFDALMVRYQALLVENKYDAAVIPAGMPIRRYLDDHDYNFVVNPHFKACLPLTEHPHCHLVIPASGKPELVYYQPVDFWHSVPADPAGAWVDKVTIHTITEPSQALQHFPKSGRLVLLGQQQGVLDAVSFSAQNPESLVYPLYWHRAYKSAYEIECLAEANRRAASAHLAARAAFFNKNSELGINLAYLAAAGGQQNDMPYGNIVALNQHAAILHYTDCDAHAPTEFHSFLIDAGVQVHGYASDITRTYAFESRSEFNQLISAVDELQQAIVAQMKPGANYVDLHRDTHKRTADLLQQFGIVDMEADSMVETGVTSVFLPHGLGHQLGLQVHDVGGHQANEQGGTIAPPAEYPFLRNTRTMETGQVLTIEPGVYFIDSLLAGLKESEHAKQVDWSRVDAFKPFGGVRIEDDVLITKQGTRNLTREAFAKLDQ